MVDESLRQVKASESSRRAAESVARRVSDRKAQVRRLFVVSQEADDALPPMARMLRGGRGGSVRLKLYLSLLWFAANPPYDVTYPARAWAQLLDLPDPEGSGARRISEALAWLRKNRFIQVQQRPGLPSRVLLLEESGSGSAYTIPGATWRTLEADTPDTERQRQRYLQLPPALWTNGWLQTLDGASIAMLLIILAEQPAEPSRIRGIWFSPSEAAKRYALSPGTRTKGVAQLSRAGVIIIDKIAVSDDPFDLRRTRNAYRLQPERLNDTARWDDLVKPVEPVTSSTTER
jgi:hypothetical protein